MMEDVVTLVKGDGRRFERIDANVQPKMIFIDDAKIPVEEGDHIERRLPNGLLDQYLVLDRGFFTGGGGIPDHYQIQVRKVTAIPRNPMSQTIIYNLHGANARVNIQSHDQSTNVVNVSATDLFNELRKALSEKVQDEARRKELIRKVAELESTEGSPSYVEKYKEFMAVAADHITVIAPFIPALAQLLG
jgi:hypothetical protein